MNLFARSNSYYHLLKHLLFLLKHSACICVCIYIYIQLTQLTPYHPISVDTIQSHSSWHPTIPFLLTPYNPIPVDTLQSHSSLHPTIPFQLTPYNPIPVDTLQSHSTWHPTIPFHLTPYHPIPVHTLPFHSSSHPTIPFQFTPYHSIPVHTLPSHSLKTHLEIILIKPSFSLLLSVLLQIPYFWTAKSCTSTLFWLNYSRSRIYADCLLCYTTTEKLGRPHNHGCSIAPELRCYAQSSNYAQMVEHGWELRASVTGKSASAGLAGTG
jgi:hypothetical protein